MCLIVIGWLLLSCAPHHTWSLDSKLSSIHERASTSQKTRRRHLLSSLDLNGGTVSDPASSRNNLKQTAAYRIQRDWLTEIDTPDQVPNPELYYQDLENGDRQLIWAFDDTLPRDVLAGRPDVWLQATFEIERDANLLLPFLEHYSRLGVAFERMIFTLIAPKLENKELLRVQMALRHVGANFWTLLLNESGICKTKQFQKAVYETNLRATYRVPIKDWILAVEGNELIQFKFPSSSNGGGGGGGNEGDLLEENNSSSSVSAEEYFERLELQGSNWVTGLPVERISPSGFFEKINPKSTLLSGSGSSGGGGGGLLLQFPLECHFKSNFPAENRTKIVAYRGYLRPDLTKRSIVSADKAKYYFNSLQKIENDGGDVFLSEERIANLYDLTPYSRYWEFYKTPLMVGNVYLWSDRKADALGGVLLHRFQWHHSRVLEESLLFCENTDDSVEKHDAVVFSKLIRAGKVDLQGESGIECEEKEKKIETAGEDHHHRQLPLRKEPALSLAALRSMY